LPKVGVQQIICGVQNLFLDLQTFRKWNNLRICDLSTIYFLRFTDLRTQFFFVLKNFRKSAIT
jgi:hypothetical protein